MPHSHSSLSHLSGRDIDFEYPQWVLEKDMKSDNGKLRSQVRTAPSHLLIVSSFYRSPSWRLKSMLWSQIALSFEEL